MTRVASTEDSTDSSKFVCNQNALLMTAIDAGSIEEVRKLLIECGDLTVKVVNSPCGRMKITALQLAAAKGRKAGPLVKLLLANGAKADISDKLGRTPLHNAALIGNSEAVGALLKAGANVESCFEVSSWPRQSNFTKTEVECNEFSAEFKLPFPECWGRTPLHQAVKGGSPECVHLLLQAKANVNAMDENKTTPLLLAGVGIVPGNKKEITKYEEVVTLLVKAGANPNAYNEFTGMTSIHHAASLCSLRAMKCLLDAGAVPMDKKFNGVTTVLHEATGKGFLAMVQLLLDRGASNLVNSKDRAGYTPLHKAAYVGARDCLSLLLKHGGDLAAESNEGVTVMDVIFSHIPRPINFIEGILDRSITSNDSDINTRDFKVTLDFSVLCPHGADKQMAVVTALMGGGSDTQQKLIVRHPLFETFLRFKWHRLRIFFYMLMVVHFGLVISLSTFCSLRIQDGVDVKSTEVVAAHMALMITASVLAIHLIIQIVMLPRHYIMQYETWINLICIILSFTIAVGHLSSDMMAFLDQYEEQTSHSWILHIMSFAVLLVWIEFMLLIGRIPKWGYYALMFYQVLRNVIKVLLTFGGLVIGFTLSFRVQFHTTNEFKSFWLSLVKTMVMMMGEYEYNDLFDGTTEDGKKQLRLPGTSRVIFFAFIVLSSIVLMNLMVGLAVSDIQELQAEGHTQRLLKQAEFVTHLERLTTHYLLKSALFPGFLRRMLDNRRSIDTKFVVQPSELSSGDKNMSYHQLERIVSIAIKNKRTLTNGKTGYTSTSSYNYSDQDLYSSKSGGEYGSSSDDPSPSPVQETSNIITLLQQLQMELSEIKQTLNSENRNNIDSNDQEESIQPIRISRWTRPITEIQEAQGMLRRLRRANSGSHNAIV